MNRRSPRLLRYLDDQDNCFCVKPPRELVPAEHFAGTDLTEHRFSFYGEVYKLPRDIDWERNPGSGHWGHDLNRFGFLILHDTGDERQAQVMEQLILDWITKNGQICDSRSPYAWQNLLNIGIRIENWWRFLALRKAEGKWNLSRPEWDEIKLSIFQQLLILLRMIDRRGYESNWTPIGLRAALSILFSVPSLPFRERLIHVAWRGILRAAERQILPDGAQQELSPHYHWVTLELFVSCRAMALQAGRSDYRALEQTIVPMARFLDSLMLPDGGILAFGDSDFDYGPRIKQFLDGLQKELPFPRAESDSVYPYAGLAILRHEKDGHILAFDAGPYGTAHQHEDALSFWLTAFGEHFIVDPGRYLYDYEAGSMYNHLRSTSAHSTISIAGFGQNAKAKPEAWRRSKPAWPKLAQRGSKVALTGYYDGGYGEVYGDIRHERTIEFDKDKAHWVIHDHLSGEGKVPIEVRFQFAPSTWLIKKNEYICRRGDVELTLAYGSEWHSAVYEGEMSPKCGWYSSGLARIEPAPCLLLTAEADLPAQFKTEITAVLIANPVLPSTINPIM